MALVLAVAAWRRGWWGVASRVYYALVNLARVGFVGFPAHWRVF